MKSRVTNLLCCLFLVLFTASFSSADMLTAINVEGSGSYSGDLSLLTDGSFTPDGQQYQIDTVWWTGTQTAFTFDYGSMYDIDGFKVSVDNNDNYLIEYSTNNTDWSPWVQISRSDGTATWGMETISNISGDVDYWPYSYGTVSARYLRISAIAGGDNYNSVGELQAFGSAAAAVPEPATMILLGMGIVCLASVKRRQK